jgi:hypothetical protein
MVPTPRQIARKVKRSPPGRLVTTAAESTADFARGFRFANSLGTPRDTEAPFAALPVASPIEQFFDAHTEGPGITKWRHYFHVYHRHLAKFRGQPVRVVEIGVFGGGSLGMWRDYFGPGCRMIGVDFDPECAEHATADVEIFIGDQSDPHFWADFTSRVDPVDVVLDDGGHEAYQQIPTLEALLPHMRPGVVYICEDIHDPLHAFHSYIDGLGRPLHSVPIPGRPAPVNGAQQHIASVHRYPLLAVIEKPEHRVPDFEGVRRGDEWPPGRENW